MNRKETLAVIADAARIAVLEQNVTTLGASVDHLAGELERAEAALDEADASVSRLTAEKFRQASRIIELETLLGTVSSFAVPAAEPGPSPSAETPAPLVLQKDKP